MEGLALPISTKDGRIIGVELKGVGIDALNEKNDFFERYGLLAVLNASYEDAVQLNEGEVLPTFVRLMISEDFPNLHDGKNNPVLRDLMKVAPLWLGDLGAGHSNLEAVQAGMFEAAVLDRSFTIANIDKPTFRSVLEQIGQHTRLITPMPTDANTWAYGRIRGVRFSKIELLIT